MKHIELLSIDWIKKVKEENKINDPILVEKVIRALLLLEGLASKEISFVFKGGTSLMLHFSKPKRLSIDIDIIIEEKDFQNIEESLDKIVDEQGFNRKELQNRIAKSKINKAHYKFFYTPINKTNKNEEDFILLDILFEKNAYNNIIEIPIKSSFLPLNNNPICVKVPCLADLLGDKLTAFAPNTTGIPYFKNGNSMSMEIIKQLYDIGVLFDACDNVEIVRKTFLHFAKIELDYRSIENKDTNDVLNDVFQTSLCIASHGKIGEGSFKELQDGINRIKGFIFSETYHIDKAIVSSSKAAYISALIESQNNIIDKYENPLIVKDWSINNHYYSKLNKLKKINSEAFFYWYKALEIKNSV